MQTATKLVEYARSLCDLENSQFISYDDEKTLLNEAYRDLYSLYTETSGDYWTEEAIIQLTSGDIAPNSVTGTEYLVDLPENFYKIRFLSWNTGGRWQPVKRFSTSMRDSNPSQPYYRLKNNKLWIISPVTAQLRITYYIPPVEVTLPNYNIPFLESLPIYDLENIGLGQSIDNKMVYVATDGITITVEDKDTGDITGLYSSVTDVKQLQYYGGYLYWLEGTTLYRAQVDYTSTLVPVEIGTLIQNYLLVGGFIYYSTPGETYRAEIEGSGPILVLGTPSLNYQTYDDKPIYISDTGFIVYGFDLTTITAERLVQYDGLIYFYDDKKIKRLVIEDDVLSVGDTLQEDVLSIGYVNSDSYMPIRTDENIHAKSMIEDTEFDYPSNEVNEIMAYLAAVGFARKQSDATKMNTLSQRLGALMARFNDVSKRDEYQFYRINDDIGQLPTWY